MINEKKHPNWLWDRKTTKKTAQNILKDGQSDKFVELAALLLSRKNIPKEVFGEYIEKIVFVKNWARIKKCMRKNNWNHPRIIFWQAIYENLLNTYKEKGIKIRKTKSTNRNDELCQSLGKTLKHCRVEAQLTQRDLARKLNISQQIISSIENGKENPSIQTIKKIAKALNKNVRIVIE
ncbi:MAG: helix-turn-helix domain-containing protein [Alphaproteobacteria bacterium]